MPWNAASGASCSINLLPENAAGFLPAVGLPCTEYRTRSARDGATGAVQEIATIESQGACPFEIALTLTPNAYSHVSASAPGQLQQPSLAPAPPLLQPPSIPDAPPDQSSALTLYQPPPMLPCSLDLLQCPDYAYEIILDGVYVGESALRRSTLPRTLHDRKICSSDLTTERRLQFAPVQLVDPDDHMHAEDPTERICQDEKVIKAIGTIQINVYRCRVVSRPRPTHDSRAPSQTSNQMKFDERSKKASLSTTAGLAPAVPNTQALPMMVWEAIDHDPHPFLQFIFHYKPRCILELEGIIPPTVQPAGSVPRVRNTPDDDTDDDISVVDRKEIKREKKPSTEVIEIKSESEGEEEEHQQQRDRAKAKRIKIEAKKLEEKKKKTDKKPSLSASSKDKKKPVTKKTNFLDLTGSDDA
ncbi:hypothetical protein PCASD_08756 [Puccinia coronata f. sp. avenae]|uniref:DUF7918 domain-containing protein n=1 Tax=Puccinia coronata f. sp. avenae TaxID=200324 RepID=A0A2N5TEF2_9BASI|nr:hypothetical protein PCASD_08756 [Puccinia coronata f. sp. avenae]